MILPASGFRNNVWGDASCAVAAQKVLSAPSDGYYLFQGSPNELILAPLANAAMKNKADDFRQVQTIAIASLAVMARKDLPANNADELSAYATKVAKEGKPLTYASVGQGSFYRLLGEHMSKTIAAPMTHVPYKGGDSAVKKLLAAQAPLLSTRCSDCPVCRCPPVLSTACRRACNW